MIMRSTNNSILIKHAYYKRRARAIIANVSLIAIVLCICIMMLLYGNTNYSLDVVIRVLRGENIQGANFAIATLRLPRMLSGLLVGIAFGIAGNTFQTMLRNPLASPDIIGVTSGSSVAAVFLHIGAWIEWTGCFDNFGYIRTFSINAYIFTI